MSPTGWNLNIIEKIPTRVFYLNIFYITSTIQYILLGFTDITLSFFTYVRANLCVSLCIFVCLCVFGGMCSAWGE